MHSCMISCMKDVLHCWSLVRPLNSGYYFIFIAFILQANQKPNQKKKSRRRLGWKLIGVDPNTTDSLTLFAGLDHLAAVHAADNNTVVLEKKSETSVQKENDDDDDDDDDESSALVVGDTTAKALSAAFEIGARRALDLTAYSLAERFFRLSLAVVGLSVDAKPTHSRQLWQRIVVDYVDCQIGLCNIQTGEQVVGNVCVFVCFFVFVSFNILFAFLCSF